MKVMLLGAALALALPGAALAKVTAVEDLRRGMAVTVEGTVERITDEDEFLLADASGRVLVYIGSNAMPVRDGEKIRVAGRVDDDGPLEIYATEITLETGQTVVLSYRY
ncbi:NirD/YgiW/YdeI family stress tolerance protein [Roseicyclus sp.]